MIQCHASSLLLALLVLSVLSVALAQEASATAGAEKQFRIARLEVAPRIDGRLDESVWEEATLISDLHQVEPMEFAEPGERTEIRVFYTRDALYVGARMYQDPARITANIQKQGADVAVYEDDWFGFDIDPWHAQRNGYFFIVNANGVRWDGSFKNISGFDHDWSGIWNAEARRDSQGWTAEFELPFNAVSFDPDTDTWGLNFERRIARTSEYIAWSTRGQAVNPSTNGDAIGFSGMQQGLGLGVVSSAVARSAKDYRADSGASSQFDPALDVFYRITPELTATLTANTDFSATEVDTRRVNLSRFSLFFPEKRDFFLRDADIFEFGHLEDNGRPFFSRRIGLNGYGHPIDIDYGGKLSGHFGILDLGSLYIRQGEDPETGISARDIVVARAAAHVLSESSVGAIFTQGDPQSERDNMLVGADFSLRNSRLPGGRSLRFDGWFQQSETEGLTGDDGAWGLALTSTTPIGWYGLAAYKRIEANFSPALGFVNRAGIEDLTGEGGYRWRFGRGSPLQLIELGSEYYRADTLADGHLSSSLAGLHVTANNQHGDSLTVGLYDSRELLTEDFAIYEATDDGRRVVIPAGEYEFAEGEARLTTNPARRFSGSLALRGGEYYDGTHWAGEIAFAWKPSRHLNTTLSMSQDRISLEGGEFTVRLLSAGATVAFDSHWSWTSVAQYDNVSELFGFNSRLHWTPRAGRNAYLVVNLGREDLDRDRNFQPTNWEVVLKYSHDLRY